MDKTLNGAIRSIIQSLLNGTTHNDAFEHKVDRVTLVSFICD